MRDAVDDRRQCFRPTCRGEDPVQNYRSGPDRFAVVLRPVLRNTKQCWSEPAGVRESRVFRGNPQNRGGKARDQRALLMDEVGGDLDVWERNFLAA